MQKRGRKREREREGEERGERMRAAQIRRRHIEIQGKKLLKNECKDFSGWSREGEGVSEREREKRENLRDYWLTMMI
jgi:hypothetical protein